MDKKIIFRKTEVHYRFSGKGRPVFLLHGFAEDSRIWRNQWEDLEDHYQLILPDFPGSGHSPFNPAHLSIDDYADAIRAIADQEQLGPSILIGHSMGGYVALAYAEKFPKQVAALGLFHSTAYSDTEEKREARKKSIGFIREYGAAEFLKTSIPNLFAGSFNESHGEVVQSLVRQYSGFRAEALIAYYEAMMSRPDRTAVLQDAVFPVLFVIGEEDKAIPFQDSLRQCHLPSLAFIHILKNCGHMGMIEEVAASNALLKDFLNKSYNTFPETS